MKYIKFENLNKINLKKFLKEKSISLRASQDLFKKGIIVNDEVVFNNIQLDYGDIIKIKIDEEELDYKPITEKIDIIYEDDNILVINKPSGVTVNSKNQISLSNYLANYFQENKIKAKIRLVNRLDMNTSGLMMVAKNKYAQAYYQKEIEENHTEKKYIACVEGELKIDQLYKIQLAYDEISKSYIENKDGSLAITYFNTVESNCKYSIIECTIKTGKTHQIRASLKTLGHPILGDKLYGSSYELPRFLLHSYYLAFNEFVSQERIILRNIVDFKTFLTNL
ncbi:RluA family pseudouridine synthase [uncultured Anaerococcus sp.]|uniref:RluA family pseudouridine synthase n=1 Tax=uncultured Anaerococcus sp. TaxID=293428 RepID=UPI00288B513D|nr:RluA family pseudouridine synthase [uncultured Anaerococcus sp.]